MTLKKMGMKKAEIVIIIVVLVSVTIATLTVVVAQPKIPESYWGYATLDDAPAVTGTPITVEVYGTREVVGNTTVENENGLYNIDIYISSDDNPDDGYALDGDSLTWKIDGIVCSFPSAGTDTAVSEGTNDNFNITASHPPPAPPPVAVPEFNVIGLLALIGILSVVLAFATPRRKK